MIPIHLLALLFPEARSTDAGTTVKHVSCEECGLEYVYEIRRRSQGRATGFLVPDHRAANRRAADNLHQLLKDACDPVPCPACGWYQQSMIRRARQLHCRGLWMTSLLFLVGAGALACTGVIVGALTAQPGRPFPLPALVIFLLAGGTLAAAPLLVVAKFVLAWFHDPNAADRESRIEQGRRRAVSATAYLQGSAMPPHPLP